MQTKIYNKLVRDRIPSIIKENNETPSVHIANDQEYKDELNQKLVEETNEWLESGELEELADVLEVVYALAELHGSTREALEVLRQKKADERGAFRERVMLEWVQKKQ